MNSLRLLVLALACLAPAVALAQWQWVDKDGRKVFSDRPPPADVPANKILKRPGGQPAPAEAAATPASAASAPATPPLPAPPLPTRDRALEERRKQAEAQKAAKTKEEDERQAAAVAENCARARRSKANIDSGVRITQLNDKGEREFLDDKQIAAEAARLDALIARDCKPGQ